MIGGTQKGGLQTFPMFWDCLQTAYLPIGVSAIGWRDGSRDGLRACVRMPRTAAQFPPSADRIEHRWRSDARAPDCSPPTGAY